MNNLILAITLLVTPLVAERQNIPPILQLGVEEWWWIPFDEKLYEGVWLPEDIPWIPDWEIIIDDQPAVDNS